MKVLHVISSLASKRGGTVELVRTLSAALLGQGCSVTIVSLDEDRDISTLPRGISHVALGRPRLNIRYSFSLRLLDWLSCNARAFDVVIVHGIWQFASLAALIRLPALGVPYVIYAHRMLTDH